MEEFKRTDKTKKTLKKGTTINTLFDYPRNTNIIPPRVTN